MIRWRWLWFSLSMLLLVIAWPASQRLHLDRSLQRMFDPQDPNRIDFELLQEKFGVSDLVVFAYRDPELWNPDGRGLERLQRIRESIEALDGISTAMDLSKLDKMLGQLNAPLSALNPFKNQADSHPILDPSNKIATRFKEIFEGQTHSGDGKLVAIGCLLKPQSTEQRSSTSQTIAGLRSLGNALPLRFDVEPALLVGQAVMVEEGFEEIEKDGVRLGYFSTIGLSLLIIVGFRSVRWAIATIAVVQWSLIITRAVLVWLAWDLTMVSSMLSSIVTVIGVATTVHWMLDYRSAMATGMTPEEAMRVSLKHLWWPIFWACITDAIGFASLAFADVGPVQDYGCMMALAALIVLVGIFTLIPVIALVPIAPVRIARWIGMSFRLYTIPGDNYLQVALGQVKRLSARYPKSVVFGALSLGLLATVGSMRLQVETDFIKNFRKDAPLVIAYHAVETELGGAGVWDVVLPAPKILTQEYLELVLALEKELMEIQVDGPEPLRLTKVLSFADADAASRSSPMLSRLSIEARLLGMRQVMGDFVNTLITQPGKGTRHLRIMLRSLEQSETDQKEQLIAKVRKTVEDRLNTRPWQEWMDSQAKPSVSGYYVLLSRLVSSIVGDQWRCFLIATFGIWIAMSIALRSPWLALLTILPNALPSLCIMGWMGWSGTRVNLGAAMIAAVSMGLSVDSSLHYLLRFQSERSQGASFSQALDAAQSDIGMAMLLSTVALVIGFGSMSMSDFLPTVVFGTMAAISMVGGLIGNITILPALLVLNTGHSPQSR